MLDALAQVGHIGVQLLVFFCFSISVISVYPGHTLLPIFPSFRPMGMVGEACLPSNAYYPRTPDYTLCSGVHVCWSEHSDSSFVYGFMILDYGFGTMTATTYFFLSSPQRCIFSVFVWFLCSRRCCTDELETLHADWTNAVCIPCQTSRRGLWQRKIDLSPHPTPVCFLLTVPSYVLVILFFYFG